MVQFILYFLAIIGVCAIGKYVSFVVKLIKDYDKEDELNINVKGSYTLGTGLQVRLEDSQRDKRVFSDKFPTNSLLGFKSQSEFEAENNRKELIKQVNRTAELHKKISGPYGYLNDAMMSDGSLRNEKFPERPKTAI